MTKEEMEKLPSAEDARTFIEKFEELCEDFKNRGLAFVGSMMIVHEGEEEEPCLMGQVEHWNTDDSQAVLVLDTHIQSIKEYNSAEPIILQA